MDIILASDSPRRKELLKILGIDFTAMSAKTDETVDARLPVGDEIKRLSYEKAKAVSNIAPKDSVIIGADTAVVLDNRVFGKPANREQAYEMLKTLSGKTHKVITAVTVMKGDKYNTEAEITEVTFRELSDTEIYAYIDTGDPFDKAGGYALQGISSIFVSGIKGDHFGVYGLSLFRLAKMLRSFGVKILGE